MALGVLGIMYFIVFLGVIIAQFLLYREKSGQKFFIINMALGILLSLLMFTSLPSNYTAQRMFSLALGALVVLAFYLKTQDKNNLLAKGILSISVLGNLVQLFI